MDCLQDKSTDGGSGERYFWVVARRSICWRWLMSWPAMVSTMVQKGMVPRSGWVVGRRRSSSETVVRKRRFQLRAAWKRARPGSKLVGCVAFGPGVLVEGLDDGVGLAERGGEGLAEAEGEDDLAVGEVGDDLADAPLARGRDGC